MHGHVFVNRIELFQTEGITLFPSRCALPSSPLWDRITRRHKPAMPGNLKVFKVELLARKSGRCFILKLRHRRSSLFRIRAGREESRCDPLYPQGGVTAHQTPTPPLIPLKFQLGPIGSQPSVYTTLNQIRIHFTKLLPVHITAPREGKTNDSKT